MEVMKHIKKVDSKERTVIMVQPENEPGSLETDRDYSDEANRLYFDKVPVDLVNGLKKEQGTWDEVFGSKAVEALNSYNIAKYIK